MAKFYSSLFFLLIFFPSFLIAQNVGIGTSDPREKLEVAGAIMIGTTTGNLEGTIRFNRAINKFEGRDTVSWNPFGSGSGESLWTKDGINIYPDTPQYSGNVGIGTIVPLTKLHIKGNGNIALRAETANDTLPTVDIINTTGMGLRVVAQTNSDDYPAVMLLNKDSAGYALKVVSWAALDTINGEIVGDQGGNAAHFAGDVNFWGAIRNTDSTLYGGSIAVNDGMTVGDIAGASCTPVTAAVDSFVKDFGSNFVLIYQGRVNNPVYSNIKTFSTTKDCRAVTNFYFEPYVGDEQAFPLDFEFFVRDQFIGSVFEPSANPNQNPPLPLYYPTGNLISFGNSGSLCGCWTSKWGFNSSAFNGQDPNDVVSNNWYVQFSSNTSEGEYLMGYKGRVNYKWADSLLAPHYAAYGDIRASGSIYANSDQLLGDVAEYFEVVSSGRQPELGDIVSISRKDPQTFELSTIAYDPLLVGVVSENPSVHLNDPSSGLPIGLTGRVKVKVNLSGGKIQIGDPITSSSVEGVGMKASGKGTIVGYALEAFDGSRTDMGKIVILLARGHVEKLSPSVKVEEVHSSPYGGMVVKGAVKVIEGERSIFIPWDAQLAGRIPSDVEFDDLFVELTPFGGDARLIVKEVNGEGITVEIVQKSSGFAGFFYQTDIVTSKIESLSGQENAVAKNPVNYEERLERALRLHKDWDTAYKELQKKGGMSLAPIQSMTNAKQANLYKKDVIKSWQRNEPALFDRWQSLGRELSQAISGDQSIIRKIKEAN